MNNEYLWITYMACVFFCSGHHWYISKISRTTSSFYIFSNNILLIIIMHNAIYVLCRWNIHIKLLEAIKKKTILIWYNIHNYLVFNWCQFTFLPNHFPLHLKVFQFRNFTVEICRCGFLCLICHKINI